MLGISKKAVADLVTVRSGGNSSVILHNRIARASEFLRAVVSTEPLVIKCSWCDLPGCDPWVYSVDAQFLARIYGGRWL